MTATLINYGGFSIRTTGTISEIEDVLRCLSTLLGTYKGTWPLNREFGIDWRLIDEPAEDFKSDFTMDVIEAVEKYEPRVTVTEVDFTTGSDGSIVPIICIEAADADEEE